MYLGCSQASEGHAASRYILWNCPQQLHLGSVYCHLNQLFLAVTANYCDAQLLRSRVLGWLAGISYWGVAESQRMVTGLV